MKGKFIKDYHLLLVENHLDEFEKELSFYFFTYFGKLLPLQYSYLDWLVFNLRPIQNKSISKNSFNSDYIKSQITTDPQKFITFLQFLNYLRCLDYEVNYIENIPYRVVVFRLQDFLEYQNKNNNTDQRIKMKDFFDSYPSVSSNQRKNNIKNYYIELVQTLQESNLIQPYYKIIYNGSWISTDQLTPSNIYIRRIYYL